MDRRRPQLQWLDGLRPLHRGPAVIAALLHAVHHLPQFPADVADKELAGLAIEAHPPGIAEAVGPNLRPGLFHADERVVLRNGVVPPGARALRLAWIAMVHVDAQDG